jgi:hypothetical protein
MLLLTIFYVNKWKLGQPSSLTPDRSRLIAVDQINEAKELLIQRSQTRWGQLADKLSLPLHLGGAA